MPDLFPNHTVCPVKGCGNTNLLHIRDPARAHAEAAHTQAVRTVNAAWSRGRSFRAARDFQAFVAGEHYRFRAGDELPRSTVPFLVLKRAVSGFIEVVEDAGE